MISRVTSSSVNAQLTKQISNQYANYAKITEQISSGYKINSLLDDPIQAVNIVSSNREINRIGIFTDNVNSITNEVKQSSETIELINDKAQRAKDLAVSAASGTSSRSTLESTLTELNQLILGVVDMANTEYNGNYIYSGTNTKTPPYTVEYGVDADGNTTNEIIGVKYNGTAITDDWQRGLEISDGVYEEYNVTGIEAFGECDKTPVLDPSTGKPVLDPTTGEPTYTTNSESGLFKSLIDLKNSISDTIDALKEQEDLPKTATQAEREAAAAKVTAGYTATNGVIDEFTDSMSRMTTINSAFGSLTNRMEMTANSLTTSKDNLTEYISGIRDVDLTEAVTDWYSSQYAYQASMQASTSIMSMSLLNYF